MIKTDVFTIATYGSNPHVHQQTNKMWSSIQWTMSAIRKNKILPFAATWMDLENSILHKIYQTEKDKYYMKSYV